jgi:1-hydroxycarotenoid 3,4-desaturase
MKEPTVVIVGAGIGGLAAALRLASAGVQVTVVEARDAPGGKMRTLPSVAGPVDAGPTVLTMRGVFDDLFAAAGERLEDHLGLVQLQVLARHYWRDGTVFDLHADPEVSAAGVRTVFGAKVEGEFRAFHARAARLFAAFDTPMMQAAAPSQADLVLRVARAPGLVRDMAPWATLAGMLRGAFSEPKLAQLFGRYATYVGGSPYAVPALLALIAEAEMRGVWAVAGGMHALARAVEGLARARGAVFRYGEEVRRIEVQGGRAVAVQTAGGRIAADAVLFNGDPRAIALGHLGEGVRRAVPVGGVSPRSLSAYVHAFAAVPRGVDLAYHTVFFADDPRAEFGPLMAGEHPRDATLYVCAQDRAVQGQTISGPQGPERFEIILNAAPTGERPDTEREIAQCQTQVFNRLETFGLNFSLQPGRESLTTPAGFERLFPGSAGSLYGRSPQGLTAGLKRPLARTGVAGLYLCGGGAHPGAGVPMATLSARHAAGAIMTDLGLQSTSRRTGMRGGMSTGSATGATGPSA